MSTPGPIGRLGRYTATHVRVVMVAWLLVAGTLGFFAPRVEHALSGAGWEATGSESVQARQLIDRGFGGLSSSALQVVVRSETETVRDHAFQQAIASAQGTLQRDPRVSRVVAPLAGRSISRDGHRRHRRDGPGRRRQRRSPDRRVRRRHARRGGRNVAQGIIRAVRERRGARPRLSGAATRTRHQRGTGSRPSDRVLRCRRRVRHRADAHRRAVVLDAQRDRHVTGDHRQHVTARRGRSPQRRTHDRSRPHARHGRRVHRRSARRGTPERAHPPADTGPRLRGPRWSRSPDTCSSAPPSSAVRPAPPEAP